MRAVKRAVEVNWIAKLEPLFALLLVVPAEGLAPSVEDVVLVLGTATLLTWQSDVVQRQAFPIGSHQVEL